MSVVSQINGIVISITDATQVSTCCHNITSELRGTVTLLQGSTVQCISQQLCSNSYYV